MPFTLGLASDPLQSHWFRATNLGPCHLALRVVILLFVLFVASVSIFSYAFQEFRPFLVFPAFPPARVKETEATGRPCQLCPGVQTHTWPDVPHSFSIVVSLGLECPTLFE